jgi:hypothetical protein
LIHVLGKKVGVGERIVGKKFGERIQISTWALFSTKQTANFPVNHHPGYRISSAVLILGDN